MITFEDITVDAKKKYCFDYISNELPIMSDVPDHRTVGECTNKIHGFKYSIIGWDHYYNPVTDDYDVVFAGSYRFFSITNNYIHKGLGYVSHNKVEYRDMEQLTEDCELDFY